MLWVPARPRNCSLSSPWSRVACQALWPSLTSLQVSDASQSCPHPSLCSRKQCFVLGLLTASDRNPTQTDLIIKRKFIDSCVCKVQECSCFRHTSVIED